MSTEKQTEIEQEIKAIPHDLLPGEILRKRREELGLTQENIAQRLRLKTSIIENIETNHFESHQVATFIRGYFRSYAKLVGISEKDILAALEESGRGKHKEQPMQSFSQKNKLKKHDSRIMKLTWGILIVIIGISSVWWWQNHQLDTLTPSLFSQDDTEEPTSVEQTQKTEFASINDDATLEQPADQTNLDQVSDESATTQQDPTTDNVSGAESTVAKEQVLEGFTPQSASQVPVIPPKPAAMVDVTDAETDTADATESTAAAGEKTLAMTFAADCWIQVKDSDGNILSTGLKKPGQTVTLDGKTPLSIILGAPEGVTMKLNNEPVDLSKYSSGKVARLKLP